MDPVTGFLVWPIPESGKSPNEIGPFSTSRAAFQSPSIPMDKELYSAAMDALSSWSFAEMRVVQLFSALLAADTIASGYALSDVRNTTQVINYIKLAAQSKLETNDSMVIDKIMVLVDEIYQYRNEFAHGIFLIAPNHPNSLPIIMPKHLHKVSADLIAGRQVIDFQGEITFYNINDLVRIKKAAESVGMLLDYTIKLLRGQLYRAPKERILDPLLDQPQTGLVLRHLLVHGRQPIQQKEQRKPQRKWQPPNPQSTTAPE